MGPERARIWWSADLLLLLGVALNDVDTGIYTAQLDPQRMVRASQGEVVIRHHRYQPRAARDFMVGLSRKITARKEGRCRAISGGPAAPGFPEPGRPMSIGAIDRSAQRHADART